MPVIIDDRPYSDRGYLAPTVYRLQGSTLSNWNYYRTKEDAINKLLYLTGQGGANVSAIGNKSFPANGQAITFGINVDFYLKIIGIWMPIGYKYLRDNFARLASNVVYSFYGTDGSGPYWAILNPQYFGIAATTTSETSLEKLAALDSFQRETTLMKYRYNALAGFLNDLAKRILTPTEQQVFNEGSLLINNMRAEISQVEGLSITYTKEGAIGLPVFLIIGIIAILASATAWTVSRIYTEKEKTRRINESYNLTMWVANKKTEVAQLATAGTITQQQAADINKTLDKAAIVADKVAKESAKNDPGIFTEIGTIVKWGVFGMIVYFGGKLLMQNKTSNAKA